MSARERELQARHAQLLAQLERERSALAQTLRELPSVPQLAREGLRDEWPALAARLGQWLGALLLARRSVALRAGWLPIVLGLLRWRLGRAAAASAPARRHSHSGRTLVLVAIAGAVAAAMWRSQRRPAAQGQAADIPAPGVQARTAGPSALH